MADNVTLTTGSVSPPSGTIIAADEITIDGATAKVQRVKLVHGVAGSGVDASATNPVPTTEGGTYGYAAGTTAGTVDVPTGACVKRVAVLAGSGGSVTVTIAGGATITIPAGGEFDEQIPGQATAGGDVVISGTVSTYYVSWTT
jgi:hypothetical protein